MKCMPLLANKFGSTWFMFLECGKIKPLNQICKGVTTEND